MISPQAIQLNQVKEDDKEKIKKSPENIESQFSTTKIYLDADQH